VNTSTRLVWQLGITQTVGYASSYYLSAILARPISEDLGFGFENYFAFIAVASIVGGLLGPPLGRLIDKWGGRLVLPFASILFALGLTSMSLSVDAVTFALSWLLTGIAMAAGLYDAAFATAVEILGENARKTIAGITLIAGFASTVGWPITSAIEQEFSWRVALLFWASTHIAIALPLHIFLPGVKRDERRLRRVSRQTNQTVGPKAPIVMVALTSLLFLSAGFVQIVMGAHLPQVIEVSGATADVALFAATLLGPGQVAARLLQVSFPTIFKPPLVAILAIVLHPIGVLTLLLLEDDGYFAFVVLHGMGSGFLTVAAGILPLYLFGARNYGERQGYIMASTDILLSFAPVLFGFLLIRIGVWSLSVTTASAFLALIILWFLLTRHRRLTSF
jgi:MFS family permease